MSKGDILHFCTNLINSKLISELVSSDNTVFLCIKATQVRLILISITIFFAHVQLQNTVNKALNTTKDLTQTRQIGEASTNRSTDALKSLLCFSKYLSSNVFLQNIKYCSVAFSLLFSIA